MLPVLGDQASVSPSATAAKQPLTVAVVWYQKLEASLFLAASIILSMLPISRTFPLAGREVKKDSGRCSLSLSVPG